MSLADLVTPDEVLCIQFALDVLPDSALNSIISTMDVTIQGFNADITILKTEIVTLDFFLAPLVIEKNKLLSLQQTVLAQFKLLDQAVIQQCHALGTLNQTLLASIDLTSTALTDTLNMINMKESLKATFQSSIDTLTDYVIFLGRMKSAFQTALQVRTQAKVVGQLPSLT